MPESLDPRSSRLEVRASAKKTTKNLRIIRNLRRPLGASWSLRGPPKASENRQEPSKTSEKLRRQIAERSAKNRRNIDDDDGGGGGDGDGGRGVGGDGDDGIDDADGNDDRADQDDDGADDGCGDDGPRRPLPAPLLERPVERPDGGVLVRCPA